jgi:uncharacterized repeat protein (TIGR01451 family)
MFVDSWWHRALHAFPSNRGRKRKVRSRALQLRLERLENRLAPAAVNLTPSADNTLYQVATSDPSQQLSNGAGQHFYVGETIQGVNAIRRGAIKFDLSAVPAGSIVNSVTLTLNMSMTISGPSLISLHLALLNWGEGTSNAALAGKGSEGVGIQATTNDVTWFYTFFPTQQWNTPGGDFVATASASTSVGGVGRYQWTGAGLVADVQQWVNNPSSDFGWILTGDETTAPTAKQFDTAANTNPADRPMLSVNYTPPAAGSLAIALSHTGNFRQGDTADTYMVTVSNNGPGSTAGAVTVTDTLPTGLAPTAADSGTVNGWTLSTSGQTITATRSDVLPSGNSYPTLTLTVGVADDAPANATNTATVSGGGAASPASASDPTTITQAADLTISKSHSGDFKQGDSADTYALTVSNVGAGPTAGTVTVTDQLPAGLAPTAADSGTINGWTVTTDGQTITATRSDVLAGGSSFPVLTLTVGVSATAPASITNTAAVAGGGELNTANDSASDPTTIIQLPDLTIVLSHVGTFLPGDRNDTYTILVSNVGAAPTNGSTVTVTDTLPTGLSPTAADNGTVNGWTVSSSGQMVTATRNDVLNSGSSYPALMITVSVAQNIAPVVINMATVAGGGEIDTANDTASDPTATMPVADLTITKTHTGNFRQGDAADIYTLTVSNRGSAPTTGMVTLTDTLPSGLAPTAADSGTINGWTVTNSGQTITATRSDVLADGSSYPVLTITVSVANNAPANVTNTATVAGGGEVNTNNDTASDPTIISPVADLTISKTHTGDFHPGDRADVYTITVSNVGAAPTDGSLVTVTDMLPTGLEPTTADDGTIGGWSVSTNGQTITATRSDVLANGSSYSALTLTVRVANNAPASVTNTASVAGGGEVNTANDTVSDVTTVTQLPNLTIAISHSGTFIAGGTGSYTITVSNIGATATNGPVMIIDMLPAGLSYTGPATVSGWTISGNGQSLTATRMDALAGGANFPALTFTVNVASNAPATFLNTATVSGGGEVNLSDGAVSDLAGGQSRRRRGGDTTPVAAPPSTSMVLDVVANSFTHSAEYFTNLVTQDYIQLLHRTPSAAEVNSWVGLLQSGSSDEQVVAGFTSSAEYFQQAGGTNQTWLDALYHDLLGRSADAAGEAAWLQMLAGGASRFSVAYAIATSVEHEGLVVSADYQAYLGRTPSASEVAGWVNNLQHGLSDEQLVAALAASGEFFADQGGTIPGWLNEAYQLVLQRNADPIGFSYWDSYIQNQLAGD